MPWLTGQPHLTVVMATWGLSIANTSNFFQGETEIYIFTWNLQSFIVGN